MKNKVNNRFYNASNFNFKAHCSPKRMRNKGIHPESVIQLHILRYLKGIGAVCGKTKTMGVRRGKVFCFDPYLMVGKCDLEAFRDGVMYGIEVKSEKGKLSSYQENYRKYFHNPPSRIYIEAHCLEDVMNIIK